MARSYKINSFSIDRNIGYAIQTVTGDSTQEILGYFYGQAQFVLDDIMKNSTAYHVEKNIVLFYKETPITYKLLIRTRISDNVQNNAVVSISFPKMMEMQDVSSLMDSIVESSLGLDEEKPLPLFEKPHLKTPKCLTKVRKAQYAERTKAKESSSESL